ncbi:MAG: DNA polymerase III subunit gamma/tau [Ectothiorhodospiraceae bacterium]|jgi:DNA polymerase-3 subunit gamma/tau|nr:DNA polymerase III subunit gamma/tau [Ectothiorhodospiraceae bacterium]
MSYQVLARKWRPRNFDQMVGQPHVLRALVNALSEGRLHHAYLFTGTRGVGKTSVARILAKCLNCETGVTATPCGQCSACREIDEGRFIDLIEVDAASRTKVEDTRELLENVQYAPTRGRYKVYLIDEVHMLSGHSFNALLKTLEEPPPHVKFLLATTDPQKLPVTILSRCLQFNLKAMPPDMIGGQLMRILEAEGIEHERAAVMEIARAASGSMRDALSLLDQAIAYGGGSLREAEVRDMLGTLSRAQVQALLDALADRDAPALMRAVGELAAQAADFEAVLAELLSLLHRVALGQIVPEALEADDDATLATALAARLAPEEVQLYYQIALTGRRDLPLAPDPRDGFEMLMLRMLAFRPAADAATGGTAGSGGGVTKSAAAGSRLAQVSRALQDKDVKHDNDAKPTARAAPPEPVAIAPEPPRANAVAELPPSPAPIVPGALDWGALINELGLKGMPAALAENCAVRHFGQDELCLTLSRQHEGLRTPNAEKRLLEALRERLGDGLRLTVELDEPQTETPAQAAKRQERERQREAEMAIENDDVARALRETFGAEVVPGSVRPM